MSDSVTDKFGNLHVFVRKDFHHPAFVKASLTWDQVLKITRPTHIMTAESILARRTADGEDMTGKELIDVPSWRIIADDQRVVLPELKYGFVEIFEAADPLSTLLLWFNTAEEAKDAESAHG
jgi:hypothetical protein